MLEQKLNSEQKDETQLPSSPNNGNTHVIGSQYRQTKSDAPIFKELHPFDVVSLVKTDVIEKRLFMEFSVNGEKQSIYLSAHLLLLAIKKHLQGVTTQDFLRQIQK